MFNLIKNFQNLNIDKFFVYNANFYATNAIDKTKHTISLSDFKEDIENCIKIFKDYFNDVTLSKVNDLENKMNFLQRLSLDENKVDTNIYEPFDKFKQYFDWPTNETNYKENSWHASAYYYIMLLHVNNDINMVIKNEKFLINKLDNFIYDIVGSYYERKIKKKSALEKSNIESI